MFANFMILFTRYDVSSEIMMLGIALIIWIIMLISKPVKTIMYNMVHLGIVFSILTTILHTYILWYTCFPETFSLRYFYSIYGIYGILYIAILNLIGTYVDLLSYKRRAQIKLLHIKLAITSVIYALIIFYPIVTNKLIQITSDGTVIITGWHFLIEVSGIVCAVIALATSIINFKSVSKAVEYGTLIFIPIDILILIFQLKFDTAYFISFSYVVPFTVFYCLFHSNRFDDVIGCQHEDGLQTIVARALDKKKKFVVIREKLPQIENRESDDLTSIIQYGSSQFCREIERVLPGGRIYSSSPYKYTFFGYVDSQDAAAKIALKIREILSQPFEYEGYKFKVKGKQTILFVEDNRLNARQVLSMFSFLGHRFHDGNDDEYIIATNKDITEFLQLDEVEQAVIDIRSKHDMNDERIICYVQPILNNESGEFLSGEALMRLNLNGNMINPGFFIPAAEKNNCIHTLTLIMLNKVCANIKKLEEDGYNFNAITVNCSTMELADEDFCYEVIKIVEDYGIVPSHLRLEITETTSVINHNIILQNMNILNDYGIAFYLDDYGTGFSNLERLANNPFQTIKFDKSILYSALENPKADAMVRTQVAYFKDNGFLTVVEGVETEDQYEYCNEVGFDMIQGYYFSKPQPVEKITEYFKISE